MKTIGLLGGLSWESTLEYYRIINQTTAEKVGKKHSAQIVMYSVNFADVESFVSKKDFAGLTTFLAEKVNNIEAAGVECLLICANTMHMIADDILKTVSIPLVHITDATAKKIKEIGFTKVGLLGTSFTMEQGFYKDRLKERYKIDSIIPEKEDRIWIQKIIFEELMVGILNPETRERLLGIIRTLSSKGAQGIILGCTEIPLLVKQSHTDIILFDTLEIHAKAAVEFALR